MKPELLYIESARYTPESLQLLEEHFTVRHVVHYEDLATALKNAEILVSSLQFQYSTGLLRSAQRLRFVVSNTTGINHIQLAPGIDVKLIYLEDRSEIDSITTTAELALTLILSLIRNLRTNHELVKAGNWDRYVAPGESWRGMKVGIIGLGRLGRKVADFCTLLGMQVQYYDPYVQIKTPVKIDALENLLSTSDIISVHAILNNETWGMLDYRLLSKAKRGCVLVNTARGELIVESDLVRCLEEGIFVGAGLDVLSEEQEHGFLTNNMIARYALNHSNVIITPHIGGACPSSRKFTENLVIERLLRFYR